MAPAPVALRRFLASHRALERGCSGTRFDTQVLPDGSMQTVTPLALRSAPYRGLVLDDAGLAQLQTVLADGRAARQHPRPGRCHRCGYPTASLGSVGSPGSACRAGASERGNGTRSRSTGPGPVHVRRWRGRLVQPDHDCHRVQSRRLTNARRLKGDDADVEKGREQEHQVATKAADGQQRAQERVVSLRQAVREG